MQPKPASPSAIADWKRLWAGDLPLGRVFWTFNVVYGIVLNLVCTAIGLILYMLTDSALLAFLLHLLPLPYMAFVTVGVWRSADRLRNAGFMPAVAKACSVALIFAALVI
jgi:hypothetical protein